MGVYDAKIGKYRANSAKRGVSDIIGYQKATGKFIAVEIKKGKDVVSPYQEAFLEGIRKAGGFVFVAKSFDAFRKELEEALV